MKKFGFTLAEVLITLTIIGVVAAVTLPALQANVQEQATISRYKKAINTLNNVGATLNAQQEFNFNDLTFTAGADQIGIDPDTGVLRRHIRAVLNEYAKLDRVASQNIAPGTIGGNCANRAGAVAFKDGTVFCWEGGGGHRWGAGGPTTHYGTIDVNGVRPPNTISRCDNETCTEGKRINDQFLISLFGDEVVPGQMIVRADGAVSTNDAESTWAKSINNAANWAFNK